MINEINYAFGAQPSAIRELFAYGQARKAEIGADKVFDFSIGNPSIPAPSAVADAIVELLKLPADELHAYTAATGTVSCRQTVAENLNSRFGTNYSASNFYMTMGAAAALDASINAITNPGEEVILIAPYFPEYKTWIDHAQCKAVEVLARLSDFQIDIDAVAAAITPKTSCVIVNSPNNPVGTIYTKETLEQLAEVLRAKSAEHGHPIYIISDEPYREIVYSDDVTPSWIPSIYNNAIVCYSWSKSLSLPGERIGYVLVPDEVENSKRVYTAVAGAGRALGYVCASSLFQAAIQRVVNEPTNVAAYAENRKLLTSIMDEAGYTYIQPDGAFYLWVKALEPDAQAFSDKAREHELLLVPSDSFGASGWVRLGYCISHETIVNSRQAFIDLMNSYK